MNRRSPVGAILALALAICAVALADDRERQWTRVEEALRKGLPKTASSTLDSIARGALRDRDHPEAARAIVQRIAVEGAIQGGKPEERIRALQAVIDDQPAAMRPVLEAILAHWYWQYFQENSWRFAQRSSTQEPPSDDFQTWDLPRIYAEIDRHFRRALSDPAALQSAPIAAWDKLLPRGNVPDAYRPTLFDFLAHEAIGFYASGEQAATAPEDEFEIAAEGPIFDSAEAFLRWRPAATDSGSPKLHAIRLFQDLLRFHAQDEDPSARIDVDIERLRFGANVATGAAKVARHQAALRRVAERESEHEASALARAEWAGSVRAQGDLVLARRIARVGADHFPDSPGGGACFNLIHELEAPSLVIETEAVWSRPLPSIDLRYRNLERVHFRMIAVDYEKWIASKQGDLRYLSRPDLEAMLRRAPARAWSAALPPTSDLRERVEKLPASSGLPSGMYVLLASDSPSFEHTRHPLFSTVVWVSDLALVVSSERSLDGLVLNASTGDPIPGARIRWWTERQARPAGSTETDGDGRFRVPAALEHRMGWMLVDYGDQELGWQGGFSHDQQERAEYLRTLIFTDRAIYRPGQSIRYKGISVRVDADRDRYQVLSRREVDVVFHDPNGKEIARQHHTTNDYGSFDGTFTAPRDRLLGAMTLIAEQAPGSAMVRVEEYKRPKFQVTLEAPRGEARLDDRVEIAGVATAYTGAAVDGAKVQWRVVREVRYPIWWSWFRWAQPPQPAREIAHGVTATDGDGRFQVEFVAEPDPGVETRREPTFSFSVHADVTDLAGETRSANRAVNVGFTALRAELTADPWQVTARPVVIDVRTATHDGVGISAKGRLVISRVRPTRVQRSSLRPDPRYGWDGDLVEAEDDVEITEGDDGDQVFAREVLTDSGGTARIQTRLAAGAYRAELETRDRFGKPVRAMLPLQVLDPSASRCPIATPDLLVAPRWSWEPGEEFIAVWGSGYERARAFVEVEHRGRLLQAYWTRPGVTQAVIRQPVDEAMRGGFVIRVTMVREGRLYQHLNRVDVPWSNKRLALRWEHFVSKLRPAQRETWTAVLSGPDATRATAEMVATLYDASLDAFAPHGWSTLSDLFRTESVTRSRTFTNSPQSMMQIVGQWPRSWRDPTRTFRAFPPELLWSAGARWGRIAASYRGNYDYISKELQVRGGRADEVRMQVQGVDMSTLAGAAPSTRMEIVGGERPTAPDLAQVVSRRNLEETAFFFPHLESNENGEVRMTFTIPEALTEWRFIGLAHDASLRSGLLEGRAVTAKDLMVQPNPPRFLREGDVLELTVRVTNLSDRGQKGRVKLALSDGVTGEPADAAYDLRDSEQPFDVPARQSRTHAWRIHVPDGAAVLAYKAVAATGDLSDGEEAFIPVLSRSVLVTESLPLPIRGPRTRSFDFARLRAASASPTLRHQSLTVQMVSNPAWYAVMALPYLMEYPYECAEQTFNRLYANALAQHVADSDPKIRQVFDRWRGTAALDSPLEKNQDLKAVLLEETPWLRQGEAESQARRNVGILFDRNRLEAELGRALNKLAMAQLPDGAWSWFPGCPADDYITLYIATGFGRLRHLGVEVDMAPALRALDRMDRWAVKRHQMALESGHPERQHIDASIALYLYGRSFFLEDHPVGPKDVKEAFAYWQDQARRDWLQLGSRQSQAHVALALHRSGDVKTPAAILRSLRERSVTSEELGMFWRDEEESWWWHRAPIESQVMMIEAFDEIARDSETVEECRVWLLKQKQTQDWKTTKATADAVYALLLRGKDILASDELVTVSLGGEAIRPANVEAGTGFYEQRFAGPQVTARFADISVKKVDPGVAWGSVHWQYFEDMDKVTAYRGTPLTLHKALFTRRATKSGPAIEPVRGALEVGDELVVRLELRVDRDMEYVHLKDDRGSGVEPVNVLSGFRLQDGLGYYEQTRDAASHFFFYSLPKGTYVFEYPVRVQHRGRYQSGFAQIQCMYAPEFDSHSEGFTLDVK